MSQVPAVPKIDSGPQLIVYGKDGHLRARIGIDKNGKLKQPITIEAGEHPFYLQSLGVFTTVSMHVTEVTPP